MRWVFYALLAINVVFFSWYQLADREQASEAEAVSAAVVPDVATIRLLAELGEEAELQLEKKSTAQKCDVYGPFFAAADSQAFLQAVKEADITGRQEREQVKLKPYFWVYVAPLASSQQAQAVANRLRGDQLNAEVIDRGGLKNAVALGNFETREDIESLKQRLSALNIKLRFYEKSRDYQQFWVVLDPGSETQLKGKLQQRLITDYPDIFHKQKVCKPVASGL